MVRFSETKMSGKIRGRGTKSHPNHRKQTIRKRFTPLTRSWRLYWKVQRIFVELGFSYSKQNRQWSHIKMTSIATTSNPNAKVPSAVLGTTTPSTSPNLGAGRKLPVGTVLVAYGQTVLNLEIGTAMVPVASTILTAAPAAKAPAPNHRPNHQIPPRLQYHHHPAVLPVVLQVAVPVAQHRRY